MNILFLTTNSAYQMKSFGGAEVSMKLLAEKLSAKGHRVIYVTINRFNLIDDDKLIRGRIVNGVELKVFHNIRVRGFSRFSLSKILNDFLFKNFLKKIIAKNSIKLVYVLYEIQLLSQVVELRDSGLRFKVVMRMAGLQWYDVCLKNKDMVKVYEKLFNSIDAVNFLHDDLQELVLQRINELDMKVLFKYSFIADIGSSLSVGRAVSYENLENPCFRIIMATRFSDYQKRQDILVKAIAKLDTGLKIEVKLIGGGRHDRIQQIINDLGISGKVIIIPFLNQSDLWKEMLQSDLMCHACDYEGVSKIILESMALGLPVLVSNVSPVNGYINDGVNGFLVDNDPVLWAKRIEELINNRLLLVSVSNKAMEYVKVNHNPDVNVGLYEIYFSKICEYVD